MNKILSLVGRTQELLKRDVFHYEKKLTAHVENSRFLVLGGAGTIGQAVTKEIFARNPRKLHIVDISENNLVELVRDLRSSYGYIDGDFRTFALDIGSIEYDAFIKADGQYDYVLNLSALKHVRSEKDSFTLMRMIKTNILNTEKTVQQSIAKGVKKYFCVSTDKAANPANMMGASKRIMEMFLMKYFDDIDISMARFANVAFSDGSLLHGFNQRLEKQQPIVAPNDVKRYFVIPKEAGELCLMSCILGENGDIFFPKLSEELHLITFSKIAVRYLKAKGLEPILCDSENEARTIAKKLPLDRKYPCLFTPSDTTGEKDFEEFFTDDEVLDLDKFNNLGVIKHQKSIVDESLLNHFSVTIENCLSKKAWTKEQIVALFHVMIPNFGYKETGKYLDGKM